MKRQLLAGAALIGYMTILFKIMVFKELPVIRIGSLMFRFGGTQGGPPNFIPFKTILLYFNHGKVSIIGVINLAGNIVLLIPVGFLIPLLFQKITLHKSVTVGVAIGLFIEAAQVLLGIGIFDIDDVLLNTIGVFAGHLLYWMITKKGSLSNQNRKLSGPVALECEKDE